MLDPQSWLTSELSNSSPTHLRTQSSLSTSSSTNPNLDRDLFNDLVEIVPLVQSLIDRKAKSSFTRRGSIVYTKTPSRESLSKKTSEPKGRNASQSISTKKRKDHVDKEQGKNPSNNEDGAENFSIFSSRAMAAEKDKEDLMALREQVKGLQKKLLEKDELLKSAEISINQMKIVNEKLDELKRQAEEKDSILKTNQLQLSDAKIKLADKQAALEKLQWEAMTSNKRAEKLQEDLDTVQQEMTSFMLLYEGLTNHDSTNYSEDYDTIPYHLDHVPYIDDLDEKAMQKMEEAREAYVAAVASAKEKQNVESIAFAANARLHLQAFVLPTETSNLRSATLSV